MNILFVANHYIEKGKPTQGFTAYLYRVTQAILKMGHNPIIVAGGKHNRNIIKDGIEVFEVAFKDISSEIGQYNLIKRNLKMSYIINKKVKEICKMKMIDIIQFTSLSNSSFFYYGKIPSVLRLSSYTKIAYAENETLESNAIKILSFLELLSAQRCNAVFAPSKVTANAFAKDLGRKVAVIETPFFFDIQENNYSVYYDYLTGKKYALFFGRLYAEKGILVIADILYEFLKRNNEYFVVFCGKSEIIKGQDARKILKKAAKNLSNRVIFIDAISHEKLYPIIEYSDFVILPSLMENFSNACIEAMYLKKIVIGTKGASFEQLIENGENGLLCQINDSKDLLEKMEIAVSLSEEKKGIMGFKAYKRIQQLKPEVVGKKLVRYYEYVLSANKKSRKLLSN